MIDAIPGYLSGLFRLLRLQRDAISFFTQLPFGRELPFVYCHLFPYTVFFAGEFLARFRSFYDLVLIYSARGVGETLLMCSRCKKETVLSRKSHRRLNFVAGGCGSLCSQAG